MFAEPAYLNVRKLYAPAISVPKYSRSWMKLCLEPRKELFPKFQICILTLMHIETVEFFFKWKNEGNPSNTKPNFSVASDENEWWRLLQEKTWSTHVELWHTLSWIGETDATLCNLVLWGVIVVVLLVICAAGYRSSENTTGILFQKYVYSSFSMKTVLNCIHIWFADLFFNQGQGNRKEINQNSLLVIW